MKNITFKFNKYDIDKIKPIILKKQFEYQLKTGNRISIPNAIVKIVEEYNEIAKCNAID